MATSQHIDAWHLEFDELGGYDCMTAAYFIRDDAGNVIATLDLTNYGQENCGPYDTAAPRAFPVARLIATSPKTLATLEAIVDKARKIANGSLNTASRNASVADYKEAMRELRDAAQEAIDKVRR
jgi:hypothetical protein